MFPDQTVIIFPMRATCPAHLILLVLSSSNVWSSISSENMNGITLAPKQNTLLVPPFFLSFPNTVCPQGLHYIEELGRQFSDTRDYSVS
jgi:hypothetical protein